MNPASSLNAVSPQDEIAQLFRAARKVSTPFLAINTPDPAATMKRLYNALPGTGDSDPAEKRPLAISWDSMRGMEGMNDNATNAILTALPEEKRKLPIAMSTQRPSDTLGIARKLPNGSVLFLINYHNYIDEPVNRQALWNLRDTYTKKGCMIVMLGPNFKLPTDIINDVVVLDEPLPSAVQLESDIDAILRSAKIEPTSIEVEEKTRMVDAVAGLASFSAKQVTAMSLQVRQGDDGTRYMALDVPSMWRRKRSLIETVPGLSIYDGDETYQDIGGCDNAKDFMRAYLNGPERPSLIVFIDEIEKDMPSTGDTSGVSQSLTGTMLTQMEDMQATGAIFLGPPGAAKSAMAKATGNEGDVPLIQFNLSSLKDALVGKSEQNLRQALKTIRGMGRGRVMFIATCNQIKALSPELRRRFSLTTMFFDLPTQAERNIIWQIWLAKYGITESHYGINDDKWTGAEIKNCCRNSYLLGYSLEKSARSIVPVAVQVSGKIEQLRREAHDTFISAAYEGAYQYPGGVTVAGGGDDDLRQITSFVTG